MRCTAHRLAAACRQRGDDRGRRARLRGRRAPPGVKAPPRLAAHHAIRCAVVERVAPEPARHRAEQLRGLERQIFHAFCAHRQRGAPSRGAPVEPVHSHRLRAAPPTPCTSTCRARARKLFPEGSAQGSAFASWWRRRTTWPAPRATTSTWSRPAPGVAERWALRAWQARAPPPGAQDGVAAAAARPGPRSWSRSTPRASGRATCARTCTARATSPESSTGSPSPCPTRRGRASRGATCSTGCRGPPARASRAGAPARRAPHRARGGGVLGRRRAAVRPRGAGPRRSGGGVDGRGSRHREMPDAFREAKDVFRSLVEGW